MVSFFSKGSLPTAEHFETLIYSNFNKADDRLDISAERGLQLFPVKSGQLLNFFEKADDKRPKYEILIDHDGFFIQQSPEDEGDVSDRPPLLFFQEDSGHLGIGNDDPETKLDVSGIISSGGRLGNYAVGAFPADGQWHNVFEDNISDVHAFEVMAHAKGLPGEGKYALLHAIATNTFGMGRKGISKTRTQFKRSDKIDIRWASKQIHIDEGNGKGAERGLWSTIVDYFKALCAPRLRVYNLQLRTKSHFGPKNLDNPETQLFYRVSLLWGPDTLHPIAHSKQVSINDRPKINEFIDRLKSETGIDLKGLKEEVNDMNSMAQNTAAPKADSDKDMIKNRLKTLEKMIEQIKGKNTLGKKEMEKLKNMESVLGDDLMLLLNKEGKLKKRMLKQLKKAHKKLSKAAANEKNRMTT